MAYTERISTGCTFKWNTQNIAGLVDLGFDLEIPMIDSTRQVDPSTSAAAQFRDYIGGLPELTVDVKLQWDRRDTSGVSPNILGHAGIQDDLDEGRARAVELVFEGGGAAGANVNPTFTAIVESISVPETIGDLVAADIKLAVNDPATLTPL